MTAQLNALSPRPFSYVDSACSFAYFNLVPTVFEGCHAEIEALVRLRDSDRDQSLKGMNELVLRVLLSEYKTMYYHELHHCLQSFVYPYRYLQSYRELKIGLNVLADLRHSARPIRLGEIDVGEPWRNTILEASMVVGVDVKGERLKPVPRDPVDLRPGDFTLVDLIEESTSIFQFKIERGDEGDGESYRKWLLGRRSAYAVVFRLLARLMGPKAAYIALPPLVQASFTTTWPAVAFVSLVNAILGDQLPRPDGWRSGAYYTILREWLELPLLPFRKGSPDPNTPNEADEPCLLSRDQYAALVASTPLHTIFPLARRYLDLLAEDPGLETMLLEPHRPGVDQLVMGEFTPPLTVFRLHFPSLRGRDALLCVNPNLVHMPHPTITDINDSDYLREIMKRKDISYSLFTNLNIYIEHNCHHHDCPLHPTDLCRRWSAIPQAWSQCPFPPWFASVTGRSIDPQSGLLMKIP